MIPIFVVVAGKALIKIAGGIYLYWGVKKIHDRGMEIGKNRGKEYGIEERINLRERLYDFQLARDAIKDRLHKLTAPYAHIDFSDPQFFSKTLEVLEKNLPNWHDKL